MGGTSTLALTIQQVGRKLTYLHNDLGCIVCPAPHSFWGFIRGFARSSLSLAYGGTAASASASSLLPPPFPFHRLQPLSNRISIIRLLTAWRCSTLISSVQAVASKAVSSNDPAW